MADEQPPAPASSSRPPPPTAPRAITKLPEHVVNRIAAGEIIQRPSNALKELIENSLDAGATSIKVTVKEGGLKSLQIQDNGTGIRKSDLPILCERFTTSKIKAFEDLSSLGTYGFRGEALASISHVAHLSVLTKTRDDTCAWKAAYAHGQLVPVKAGSQDPAPVPMAGNDGTVLTVEDLFYNTPQRLKSLRSASDEYARIVAVVLAYSIHNSGIAMSCRKATGGGTADINTITGASVLDNIGLQYGEGVKRELSEIKVESEELKVQIRAWCSGANYQGKKGTYLFFINNRYVDCTPLKRALESFYATILAKGTYPFVYLSLDIDPTKVDVNVHPTKKEVGFEDEDEIVELVCEKLGETLEKQGGSRSFKVQTLLPSANTPKPSKTQSSTSADPSSSTRKASSSSSKPKTAPNKLVRTDAHSQTLDALFPSLGTSSSTTSKHRTAQPDSLSSAEEDGPSSTARPTKRKKHQSDHDPDFARKLQAEQQALARSARVRIAQSECALTSVRALRKEVVEGRHEGLDQIIKQHIFVGVADVNSGWSMLQHQTKLYLINHCAFSEELLYQLALRQFGRLSRIKLKPPPNLKKVVKLAVNRAEGMRGREEAKLSGEEIVERIYTSLFDARAMLDEYFSFAISDSGEITSLPLVLPGYSPDLSKLPLFLLRLGAHVDWENEKPCFETFLRELAFFYSPAPSPVVPSPSSSLPTPPPSAEPDAPPSSLAVAPPTLPPPVTATPPSPEDDARLKRESEIKHSLQHVVFPALKQYLVPPQKLLKRDVVLATSLENLYRVFERC